MVIIAINVLVFIYGKARPDGTFDGQLYPGDVLMRADYGLYGPAVHQGNEWYRIITAGFIHADVFHILMNMALL